MNGREMVRHQKHVPKRAQRPLAVFTYCQRGLTVGLREILTVMAGALSRLRDWAAQPLFRKLTVREASQRLRELAPGYPGTFDQPVEICVNGGRWFAEEVEALADATHRAGKRPHRAGERIDGPEWALVCNRSGLWAMTGPASGRQSQSHGRCCAIQCGR